MSARHCSSLSLPIALPSWHLSSPITLSSLIALPSWHLSSPIAPTGTLPHPQAVSCCMSALRACLVPIGGRLAMQRIRQ